MTQNSQKHTDNDVFTLFRQILITYKTEHFLLLRHASTYSRITLLLQVLFCYPFYIFRPKLLFEIISKNKDSILPADGIKERTKLQGFIHRTMVGLCFGFLFWLPFWWFIVASILPSLFYGILCVTMLCFMLYCCVLFICLQVKIGHDNMLCKMPIYCTKRYFCDMSLPYFFVFILVCIGIFSLLHSNVYVGVSLFYPLSITIFLFMPRMYRFWFGFFVGVFGFYWMTLSFRFQDLSIAIPFAIICVGIVYGLLLWVLLYFQNLMWRIVAMALLFVVHPLDFNWLNIAYLSSYSVFEASLLSMLCIAFACCCIVTKSALQLLSPLLLLISLDYDTSIQASKLHAKIIETQYSQDVRWSADNRDNMVSNNLDSIRQAIDEGYPLVVLPETSFPLTLNTETSLYHMLLDLSHAITIVAGAVRLQNTENLNTHKKKSTIFTLDTLKQTDINDIDSIEKSYINTPNMQSGHYNTIYVFSKGHSLVADKNALVPFGETLPINKLLSPLFEKTFGGKFGFNEGDGIVSFVLQGLHIAIANCYEGTMELPYKTGARYILMLSNNAWFYPSTQHFMQQMIMKYYARNHRAFIYHATNYTPKGVITPNNGKDLESKN